MICKKCLEDKPEDKFYYTYRYIRHICRKCENKRMYDWKRAKVAPFKQKAVEYLGGKCRKCGYNRCLQALDFNHLRDKKFEPTRLLQNKTNWDKIKEELDKCELLCANCHREEHNGMKLAI